MLKIFEGKTPTERNKIIAAGVFGAMALLAILYNIVGLYPGSKKTITVTMSPSPTVSPSPNREIAALPNLEEVNFAYTTTPVRYDPGIFYAPDAGRNIFAFYEPPMPTPYITPPTVIKTPTPLPPPIPQPTPPQLIAFVTPGSVYAGSKTFRMEVNGDKFTPETVIIFNGNQLPTTFVSPQKLYADVPSNFISGEGGATVTVQTPDGKLFSNPFQFAVQAPPRPQFRYVGLIARNRANNDTAYFEETGKPQPFGARLNDIVAGRFRLSSISTSEVVFEDVSLGFRHRLALYRPAPGQQPGSGAGTGNPNNRGNTYNPYNSGAPGFGSPLPSGDIPGIPNNIPRAIPKPTPPKNADDDEDDDGDD